MKKISTTNIVENTRRQPFNKASLEHIQEAFQEVFSNIMKGLTSDVGGVVILHGCADSNSGATDWDITAGAVLYNGEVFDVLASGLLSHGSQVPVLSIETTYRTGDPVTFSDNNTFNVHEIRKLKWALGVSGTGLADFADLKRLGDVIRPNNVDSLYYDASGAGSSVRLKPIVIEIGDWNMDSAATKVVNVNSYVAGILNSGKVIKVTAMIKSDTANRLDPLDLFSGSEVMAGGIAEVWTDGSNYIGLRRLTGGFFDNTNYDSTSYNRGFVIIEHIE